MQEDVCCDTVLMEIKICIQILYTYELVKYDINIFIDPTFRFTVVTIKCHQHVDKKTKYPVAMKQYKMAKRQM